MGLSTANLLGSYIAATDINSMADEICVLANRGKPAYVCFATAHMLIEATRKLAVRSAYQKATLIAPDGVPVTWFVQRLMGRRADCISGPRFLVHFLRHAQGHQIRVGFYGGREETLQLMRARIEREFPLLQVAYMHSPPFRTLSAQEQDKDLGEIRAAGVQALFVAVGSPKQESWMKEHSLSLPCVCLGVGAAFEFFSGEKLLPPEWVQRLALTSMVRLVQEPRRLFVRNLYSPLFLVQGLRWITMTKRQRKKWQGRIRLRFMGRMEKAKNQPIPAAAAKA